MTYLCVNKETGDLQIWDHTGFLGGWEIEDGEDDVIYSYEGPEAHEDTEIIEIWKEW